MPIEVYDGNQPIFVAADIENNPLANFVSGREGGAPACRGGRPRMMRPNGLSWRWLIFPLNITKELFNLSN